MILIQLTGLSGTGKSTLAVEVQKKLLKLGHDTEVIDGDQYRRNLCSDLSFSKEDRMENIRRLYFVGEILVKHNIIVIIAAVNPYSEIRDQNNAHDFVRTVYLHRPLKELIRSDTKGLYKAALLPDGDPGKIKNFTGINDTYEVPLNADLSLDTFKQTLDESAGELLSFILKEID